MALFKTTADLATVLPARLTVDFADVVKSLEAVEHEYLVAQVLGKEQYVALHTAYQASTMSAAQTALLPYCRDAVGPLLVSKLGSSQSMQLSSAGWVVPRGDKLDVASMGRIQEMKIEQLQLGHRQLDRLVDFLWTNRTDYPLWVASVDRYSLAKGFVINADQFSQQVPMLGNQGYLFMRLRAIIREIENGPIRTLVCSTTLYNTLYNSAAGGVTPVGQPWTDLYAAIRKAVCHGAMARGISLLALQVGGEGVFSLTGSVSTEHRSNTVTPAAARQLDNLEKRHEQIYQEALNELKEALQYHAEQGNLPDYAASDCYDDPDTTEDDPDTEPGRGEDDKVGNFL